jgi:cytoskeletal protein RodZ
MLRKARKEQRRSLEAIATETKIPLASLRLLEEDGFDELPGDIFVRGFLKSYCQALTIGEDEILECYLTQTGGPSDIRSSSIPVIGGREISPRRVRSLSWVVALALFLLLGAVLLAIIFYPGLRGGQPSDRNVHTSGSKGVVETTL